MKSIPRFELQLFDEESTQATETVETSQETTEQTESAETDQSTEQTEEYDYVVPYNKEDYHFKSKEEHDAAAQKGLNYDKKFNEVATLKEENEALKNSEETKFMREFLKNNGYSSMKEYNEALALDGIMKENTALTKESAEEILAGRQARQEKIRTDQETQTTAEKQAKTDSMYDAFIKKYPDVKEIPQEVKDMEAQGIDVSIAYELHTLRQGTDKSAIEQETIRKLKENESSSTGSAANGNVDYKKTMTKAEMTDIEQRVLRGEKVSLT